jgi:hypothetical protein
VTACGSLDSDTSESQVAGGVDDVSERHAEGVLAGEDIYGTQAAHPLAVHDQPYLADDMPWGKLENRINCIGCNSS